MPNDNPVVPKALPTSNNTASIVKILLSLLTIKRSKEEPTTTNKVAIKTPKALFTVFLGTERL